MDLRQDRTTASLIIGVTRMAWMYGQDNAAGRAWAKRLLREWEEAQLAGTAPVRVFRHGKRRSLFTTLPILHQIMPPGRDLVLYRRMSAVEADVSLAHQRIDREIIERKQADADLARQRDTRIRRTA
jgi:hypothetical protein